MYIGNLRMYTVYLVPCIPSPPGECRFQGPAVAMLDTTLGKACHWKDRLCFTSRSPG